MAVDATDATFERDVVQRSHELPVVVDFWAEWCGPCRMLAPVLEREVTARDGRVELVKVDTDQNPVVSRRFGISGIPAVKAFRNGHVVSEFVGAQPPQRVAAFLDALTAPSEAERLLGELRENGRLADVVAVLDGGDTERALELLLAKAEATSGDEREEVRRLMVALFAELGPEHPLAVLYRRRLASVLY